MSLFLLSAATLAFEINLTRLFSVAQFYHFAFMIVSVALLGFGASGTVLTIFPRLQGGDPGTRLSQAGTGTSAGMLAAFLLTNLVPFDSFTIAWDSSQVWVLLLHYVALATPFFFSGMALGFLLTAFPASAGRTYAVNLLGSAAGCALALIAPPIVGGEGMVTLSMALAGLGAMVCLTTKLRFQNPLTVLTIALCAFAVIDLSSRIGEIATFPFLELRLSPYKSLSYALQYPGSKVSYRRWNASSRVDVVHSDGIHTLPGLSYRYPDPLPSMDGLLVDGDDLNAIVDSSTDTAPLAHLPNAVAFHLRPRANSLILEPRGGLDLLTALSLSNGRVTAIEINPLIVQAVPIYNDPRLQVRVESQRSYLRRSPAQYDVIVLSLTSSFHPVRSGAYTLGEDYRYTVESFQEMLDHLAPNGLLVVTRWLQDPPSEDLRLFALGVTSLENTHADPRTQIVAFRGFNTASILIKKSAFTRGEISSMRAFLEARAFDLTYGPGIQLEETNRYNILPESKYHLAYVNLVETIPRRLFYDTYEYDVRPPTDDHPFFGHYFKWSQAPQVLAEFGRAWQPFGGAGYFVILALLALAILLAAVLILLPVMLWKRGKNGISSYHPSHLIYFGLLGLAFLFVEIPLLQRFIHYLGQPAFAFTMVLFSVLSASGLGSQLSNRLPLRFSLGLLVVLILLMPAVLPRFFSWTLGLPLAFRLGLTVMILAPLGFLMGVPFPAGIQLVGMKIQPQAGNIPWIWAVNGASSVVASILSALLALSFGFNWVFRLGAICYAAAWFMAWRLTPPGDVRSRLR